MQHKDVLLSILIILTCDKGPFASIENELFYSKIAPKVPSMNKSLESITYQYIFDIERRLYQNDVFFRVDNGKTIFSVNLLYSMLIS